MKIEDVLEHLLATQRINNGWTSFSVEECELLSNYIAGLQRKEYNNSKAIENCKKSIESINEKLKNNKEPFEVVDGKIICLNDYQVCRLKAIRMKSKELLNILEKENKI